MTEYQLIDAYHSAEASWQSLTAIFISIVFAYFVAAYLVGARLTRFQVAIVTSLYSVFCLFLLYAQTDVLTRMLQFGTEIREISPERYVAGRLRGDGPVTWVIPLIFNSVFFFSFVAGLIFMIQVRRKSGKPS